MQRVGAQSEAGRAGCKGLRVRVCDEVPGADLLPSVSNPVKARELRWACPPVACRGTEQVRLTDLPTAVHYMEFTHAVAESCQSGHAVDLPLIPSL